MTHPLSEYPPELIDKAASLLAKRIQMTREDLGPHFDELRGDVAIVLDAADHAGLRRRFEVSQRIANKAISESVMHETNWKHAQRQLGLAQARLASSSETIACLRAEVAELRARLNGPAPAPVDAVEAFVNGERIVEVSEYNDARLWSVRNPDGTWADRDQQPKLSEPVAEAELQTAAVRDGFHPTITATMQQINEWAHNALRGNNHA